MEMQAGPASAISLIRRYVTDYINRHDFSVLPEIMADDYTLFTGGLTISGRDGPYRGAVAKQLEQFPGLMFTPHEMLWSGDRIAVRFTEHGASSRHSSALAAWPSIAIYNVRDGLLASCEIEQDYMSRRGQLERGIPMRVDSPATAPWDIRQVEPDLLAEARVRAWLESGKFIATDGVQIDDSRATGIIERIIDPTGLEITAIMSGGSKVAFHAIQQGTLIGDFAPELGRAAGGDAVIHLSGLVGSGDDGEFTGNIIRDRWGLYRRCVGGAARS